MTVRKWRAERTVNTTTAGNQVHSDVTALNDGGYAVVWGDANTSQVRGQVFNADGTVRTAELLLAGASSFLPDVTADAGGGFWLGYTRNVLASDNVLATGFNQFGGGAIPVTVAATANGEDQAAIAGRPGGGFWAAYHDVDSFAGDIILTRFDGAVTNFGAINLLNTNDQFNPDLEVLSNGNVVVAWNNANIDIRGTLLDASGSPIVSEFVASGAPIDTDDLPKITALPGGRFVVVYGTFGSPFDPGRGVAGTLYNANGSTSRVIDLHSLTDGGQSYPEVVGTQDGGFLAVWATTIDGGDSSQIRGQAFNMLGDRSGAEFIVSTLPFDAVLQPLNLSLARLADGRIVVTWDAFYDAGDGSDSSGTAVHLQIIDPRDGVVNGTTSGETLYGHDTLSDEINAFGGADTLYGLGGQDDLRGGNGDDTLNGGKGDDVGYGGNGIDTILGEQGDDELSGEDGNDVLRGGAGADLLDGGAGVDSASYASAAAGVTAALDGSLAGTAEAAGDVFVAIETLVGSNFADILRGNGNANTLQGLGGDDDLNGRGGNDALFGGLGADTLRGEAGNDRYFYNAVGEGGDSILDFASVDALHFRRTVFLGSGAQLPAGTLAAANFVTRAADHTAQDGNDYFIFQTNTRQLWYDPTGNAAAGDAVLIATLQAGATIANADIVMF